MVKFCVGFEVSMQIFGWHCVLRIDLYLIILYLDDCGDEVVHACVVPLIVAGGWMSSWSSFSCRRGIFFPPSLIEFPC